ncbi:hypothetical protein [Pseudonocardia broussonetiae]|nr:hypothetical protein [Pseudonocardia broussonetiae]
MTEGPAIEHAEYDREHPEIDPAHEQHLEAVQTRYEESIGWHRD